MTMCAENREFVIGTLSHCSYFILELVHLLDTIVHISDYKGQVVISTCLKAITVKLHANLYRTFYGVVYS